MWLIIGIVLVLVWIGSFTLLHVTSWAIHLLIIFAVISFVAQFLTGRKA